MAKSTTHANQVLDHLTGNASWTAPASGLFISLHTASPGTTGANETSLGSYARVAGSFGAASSGSAANDAAITFATDGGGAAITHFGVWDASTAGNFIRGGALSSSFTYSAAVTPEFAIGACTLSEA